MIPPLTTLTGLNIATVVAVRRLMASACVLSLERRDTAFVPGQCVILGQPGAREQREYSIYSGVASPTLDVLIRRVEGGAVSGRLCDCLPGDRLQCEGPVGFFTLADDDRSRERYLFVATGTGIAPFHAMAASYPDLDYQVLHGVRTAEEAFGRDAFAADRHVLCLSRDAGAAGYAGRVTDYLRAHPVEPDRICLLCGNVRMIDEAHDILVAQGVPADRIRAEVYF